MWRQSQSRVPLVFNGGLKVSKLSCQFIYYSYAIHRKPHNCCHTIRNLAERGGKWARYDETFRVMRVAQGWQWDLVHWELWLNAQPSGDRGAGSTCLSFPGKGRNSGPPQKVCFAFNKGAPCRQLCRYNHQCRRCGANQPSVRCPRRAPTAPVPTRK